MTAAERSAADRAGLVSGELLSEPPSPQHRILPIQQRPHPLQIILVDDLDRKRAHGGRLATMDQKLVTEVVPGGKKALELIRI